MSKIISNTKYVNDIMQKHVLNAFDDNKSALIEQAEVFNYECFTWYRAGLKMAQDGFFLVYYSDVREFLRELFNETKEQANKFSDKKVWDMYCHLCAKAVSKIAGKKEYPADYSKIWGR